jgi:hypothetical protein
MAVLKYWDATAGEYRTILAAAKGERGDPGPQGPPGKDGQDGQDGVAGSLNQLSDVTVAPDAPVGKFLGTTGVGAWGVVDGPNLSGYLLASTASATYVAKAGSVMSGALDMGSNRIYNLGEPDAADHAATKAYTDSRIWTGTQAQYDAIGTKDPTVLYVVTG